MLTFILCKQSIALGLHPVLGLNEKADFTNEMEGLAAERVRSSGHPCPVLLETAIHNGFALNIHKKWVYTCGKKEEKV